MATKKKNSIKNKVIKKTVKKKPVIKKSSKNLVGKADDKIKVTLEQRHKMICEAAYYISLDKTYETVHPTDDWLQAESFIDKICTVHTR
jgi:hypothetical protein